MRALHILALFGCLLVIVHYNMADDNGTDDDNDEIDIDKEDEDNEENMERVFTRWERKMLRRGRKSHSPHGNRRRRLENVRKTMKDIKRIRKHMQGKKYRNPARFELNEFSDLTVEEFVDKFTGLDNQQPPPGHVKSIPTVRSKRNTLPVSIDWEALGCVNPHRSQQECGSCWAFSTICTLEGAYCKKTGNLLEFSEQDLVDCFKEDCKGSQVWKAMDFVKARGNLLTRRTAYPYVAEAKMCTVNKSDQVNLGKFEYYQVGDTEQDMKEALVNYGPISISLMVATTAFKQYSGGIIYPDMMGLDPVTGKGRHAVNLIGYHTDPSGEPVYYGRNSWKETWGINNGNFLLARTPLWSEIGTKGMVYAAKIL
jgi:hypothetical protein